MFVFLTTLISFQRGHSKPLLVFPASSPLHTSASTTQTYIVELLAPFYLTVHFLSTCVCIRSSSEKYVLKVVGPSLRLKFLQISDCPSVVKIEIFAPNLVSFIYDGKGPYRTGIVMKHAPSLVMLSLAEPGDCISKAFRSVSSCFSRLQTLSLRIDLGQVSIHMKSFKIYYQSVYILVLQLVSFCRRVLCSQSLQNYLVSKSYL